MIVDSASALARSIPRRRTPATLAGSLANSARRQFPPSAARSRGFHFNRQSETCAPDLVLKRAPHKLSLALLKGLSEASGPLRTDRSPSLLNVTKVRPRNSKKARKLRQAPLVRLA